MGFDSEFGVAKNTALEHDGAWLVNRHLLVTEANVVVSDAAVFVHDGLFSLARVYGLDVVQEIGVQLLAQLLPEEFFVGQGDGLRHCLDHLPVGLDHCLVTDLDFTGAHVEHHAQIADRICL